MCFYFKFTFLVPVLETYQTALVGPPMIFVCTIFLGFILLLIFTEKYVRNYRISFRKQSHR